MADASKASEPRATAANPSNNDDDRGWQSKPPYQLPKHDEDAAPKTIEGGAAEKFEKKLEARCSCGRVRYWISREKPLVAKFCHCRGCQKLHGAPFQWAAIFHKSDILFERGAEGIEFYNSGSGSASHDLPCKLSCSHCRAPIMDEGRRMVLLFPTLVDFERRPADDSGGGQQQQQQQQGRRDEQEVADLKKGFYPDCHIFYGQRMVDIADGKPKWQGLDGADGILCDNLP